MSIDFDAVLLDPIYAELGIEAVFLSREGVRSDLTVLDRRAGIQVDRPSTLMLQSDRPAVCVRVTELEARDLDRSKMKDGRLTFLGEDFNVEGTQPKPVSGGKGELYLFLQVL